MLLTQVPANHRHTIRGRQVQPIPNLDLEQNHNLGDIPVTWGIQGLCRGYIGITGKTAETTSASSSSLGYAGNTYKDCIRVIRVISVCVGGAERLC